MRRYGYLMVVVAVLIVLGVSGGGATAQEEEERSLELVNIIGGAFENVASDGRYIYASEGSILNILDARVPSQFQRVAQVSLAGTIIDIQVAGNYIYLAGGGGRGVNIVDISDPTNPTLLGSSNSRAGRMEVAGNYVYVAAYDGMDIIDVSDPINPTLVGTFTRRPSVVAVQVVGDYAYLTVSSSSEGLQVVDVSDPTNPTLVGAYNVRDASAQPVPVADSAAYITYTVFDYVYIIDVSTPLTPTLTSSVVLSDTVLSLHMLDSVIYVTTADQQLSVLDSSDPMNPVLVGSIGLPRNAQEVYAAGPYVAVATLDSVHLIDARDPANMTLRGSYDAMLYSANDVYVAGDVAYVAERGGRVQMFDVSNILAPTLLGSYEMPNTVQDVQIVDKTAYFASGNGSFDSENVEGGLHIVDVMNPAAPVLLGSYGSVGMWDVQIVGTSAYLAAGADGLHIIDVSNPSSPTLIGHYVPEESVSAVQVMGDYAYLAGGRDGYSQGLLVVDISDLATPVQVGSFSTSERTYSLQIVDTYVYLGGNIISSSAGLRGGLYVIDISDPTNPEYVTDLASNVAIGRDVQIVGNYAYIAGATRTLMVADVSNPARPQHIDGYAIGTGSGVHVAEGYIYLAVNTRGLHILQLREAAPPPPSPTARCFEETGYCIDGRIREYWEQNGGLPVFGFPISAQRTFTIEGQPIEAQWFERNRLELHPENAPPYDVLLGRLGVDVLEQQGRDWQAFPTADAPQPGCRYFAETQQNVCGDILSAWRANGLELGDPGISERESLALFGLPISPLQEEDIEGQTYQVQWFERARFELHPDNEPPFNVLLGLLGREAIP